MKRISTLLLAGLVCCPVWANPISGKISSIRYETQLGHIDRAGYVSLQISGHITGPKGTFLFLSPEDKTAISLVQLAYANDFEIEVFYDETKAPWGIGACPIRTIWVD